MKNMLTILSLLLLVVLIASPLTAQQVQDQRSADVRSMQPVRDGVLPPEAVRLSNTPGQLSPDIFPPPSQAMNPQFGGSAVPQGGNVVSKLAQVIPTIDGKFDTGEWDDAVKLYTSNYYFTHGAQPVYLYIKNDCDYLYIAWTNQNVSAADWATYGPASDIGMFNFDIGPSNAPDKSWCPVGPWPDEGQFSFPRVEMYSTNASPAVFTHAPYGCNYISYFASYFYPSGPATGVDYAKTFKPGFGTITEARISYTNSMMQITVPTKIGFSFGVFGEWTQGLGVGWYYFMAGWNTYPYGFPNYMPYMQYNYSFGYQQTLTLPGATIIYNTVLNNPKLNVPQKGGYDMYILEMGSSYNFTFDMSSNPSQTIDAYWWLSDLPGGSVVGSGTQQFSVNSSLQTFSMPITVPYGLSEGFHRLKVQLNYEGDCGPKRPVWEYNVLVIKSGTGPCIVWPGDVNNDGVSNLVDRDALNKYIFEANLNPKWLYGPKRYAPGLVLSPEQAQRLRIFNWMPQPALPWFTAQGCFMDTDGNGMVHSLDNWAANQNFGKVHPMITFPKESAPSPVEYAFRLNQNYPNPFNPSTSIAFTLPEASQVSLKVIDVLGREVAILANGPMSSGSHSVTWNAEGYQSGVYMYRLNAVGLESGKTYAKTLKMTFAK